MKILSKFKKICLAFIINLIAVFSKVFAINPQDFYIDPGMIETAYGVPRPSPAVKILMFLKTCVIPIVTLIGLIIYYKKSNNTKKKKVLVTILTIIIMSLIYFFIN